MRVLAVEPLSLGEGGDDLLANLASVVAACRASSPGQVPPLFLIICFGEAVLHPHQHLVVSEEPFGDHGFGLPPNKVASLSA